VLAVNSIRIKGSGEGIEFYLLPDISKASKVGWDNVISGAMSQAFFTLSLGIGSMEIFGSYINKENTLTGESVKIVALDTFIAIMAGLIIFPACFAFDVQPDQGPSLIFVTLPQIFSDMNGGRVWGTMFFIFMVFASFSTVTAVFENLVRNLMDNLGWTRLKSIVINCMLVLVGSIPCVLGFNVWKNVSVIGSRGILDSEDFLVGNVILPVGSIIYVIFCTWKFGWGADKYLEETNTGKGMRMSKHLIPYFKYVLPVLMIIVLIRGLM
jgi:NSS family neurotransmitter:Na+ symporter